MTSNYAYLIFLACLAVLVVPTHALPQNFILVHSDEGGMWAGNNYTWNATGIIRGRYEGSITWIEHGWHVKTPWGQPQINNAYAEGDITFTNGTIAHFQLGTPDEPYVFQQTRTLYGGIFQYYMRGNVYINGRNIGYLDRIATGTWGTSILPY